jgi:hypothetical protein
VPDFEVFRGKWVVAQFDFQGAQGEVDFVEGLAEGDGAVLAHDALGTGEEEGVDFVGVFDGARRMTGPGFVADRAAW